MAEPGENLYGTGPVLELTDDFGMYVAKEDATEGYITPWILSYIHDVTDKDLDASSTMTQLDDANAGDAWRVTVAGSNLDTTTFEVGDLLVCYKSVTGTPANLAEFQKVSKLKAQWEIDLHHNLYRSNAFSEPTKISRISNEEGLWLSKSNKNGFTVKGSFKLSTSDDTIVGGSTILTLNGNQFCAGAAVSMQGPVLLSEQVFGNANVLPLAAVFSDSPNNSIYISGLATLEYDRGYFINASWRAE